MATLLDPRDRAAIETRLASLTPDRERRWGRMNASQMVCHLTDAFRGALGERSSPNTPRPAGLLGRTLVKWMALYVPAPWPRGLPTPPIADQERGGTRPTTFDRDVEMLRAARDRFMHELPAIAQRPHVFFGRLSQAQWARWAYRHMDHHLRQFGV
ncbi:MAG TPA: DUF1569 domain-containing protein [Gemmatimonadaceae bacterium]|nr:DUF1569 domain-containing protein [Gemmatimonadaceae bacterium]